MARLNKAEIEAAIPHREPFLWVDEVLEIDEQRVVARKFVDPQLDVFRGHYPHFPVLPGVLQCEMCFQAGAILISRLEAVDAGQVPVVTRINNVKFRQLIRPGETVDIEVELTERVANAYFLTGKISSAGKVCTRLEFACTAAAVE
jgi:3-hydroxyacyl-[acyl-carrier-protein] dehydratase